MPAAPNVAQPEIIHLVHRGVRLRLLPGSRAGAHQLAGTAGACRFVWNHMLALKQQQYRAYRCWQDYRIGPEKPKPQLTFFSLGREFTALRRDPRYAWLQAYSFEAVRYSLKYLADAYRAFLQGQRGYPRFQSRHRRQDGFTLAGAVKLRDHHLYVPRIGWLRVQGSNLYAHGTPRQVRIRQEGTRSRPRWYAYIAYAVPAESVKQGAATGVLGLDRNVGQVTDSTGHLYRLTDQSPLEAKIRRQQRHLARKRRGSGRGRRLGGQLRQLKRKQARIRGMTQSATGTVAQPGAHVKAKAGLNRGILASNWGQLQQQLAYKCGQLVQVPAPYTSQTCHQCGTVDPRNRRTQAHFHCGQCGFALNADHNAALNILGRAKLPVARGTGATARREAFPSGTSPTREHGIEAGLRV